MTMTATHRVRLALVLAVAALAATLAAGGPPAAGAGKPTTTTAAPTTTTTPTTTTLPPTPGQSSATVPCLNTTYVDGASKQTKATNYGSSPDLLIGGSTRRAFLACDVAAVVPDGATVGAATLHVFSRSQNSAHVARLHRQPTSWVETTVTWNTLNTFDPVVLGQAPGDLAPNAGEPVDLAAGVVGNGTARFALETATASAGGFAYASDDYNLSGDPELDLARRPSLTVTWTVPEPTTTSTLAETTTTLEPTTTLAPTTTAAPTTTLAPTTTTTAPPPGPQPFGPGGTWTQVFGDEFDGTTLDLSKWTPQDGRTNNNVLSEADNITVSGGVAHVFLTQPGGSGTQVYGGFMETSVLAADATRFRLQPGQVVEARVFMPGSCPAGAASCSEDIWDFPGLVWTAGYPWPANGEYDFGEGLGGDLTLNYHSCGTTTPPSGCGDVPSNGAPSPACCYGNEWHVVTLHRGISTSSMYVDGVLQRTITVTDPGQPHTIIVNIGRSGSRPLHLGVEGEAMVDYVRAWTPA